ncbi:MAG: YihY/virulence factor BrkB family protein, partial [Proteobacteria bacterium]
KKFWLDLYQEIEDDNVSNGAAALAFYAILSLFPALIFLLSVLPFLPIDNLYGEVMSVMNQALPDEASKAVSSVIEEITTDKKASLLSFGAIFTLWTASAGIYAIMAQLNISYDVKESRPFWKARGLAIILTLGCGAMIVTAFGLIVGGGALQTWLENIYVLNPAVPVMFQIFRWLVILCLLLAGFALIYYFGPDVKQKFKFVSLGSVIGVFVLILASLGFRLYVTNFGNYSASYGSLGAVIVLMMWFYLAGNVILLGSEINALLESENSDVLPDAKDKGEKRPTDHGSGPSSKPRPAGAH